MLAPTFFALRASLYWKLSPALLLPVSFFVTMLLGTVVYSAVCGYGLLHALRVGAVNGALIVALVLLGLYIRRRLKRDDLGR
jgi:hypothetical protein